MTRKSWLEGDTAFVKGTSVTVVRSPGEISDRVTVRFDGKPVAQDVDRKDLSEVSTPPRSTRGGGTDARDGGARRRALPPLVDSVDAVEAAAAAAAVDAVGEESEEESADADFQDADEYGPPAAAVVPAAAVDVVGGGAVPVAKPTAGGSPTAGGNAKPTASAKAKAAAKALASAKAKALASAKALALAEAPPRVDAVSDVDVRHYRCTARKGGVSECIQTH